MEGSCPFARFGVALRVLLTCGATLTTIALAALAEEPNSRAASAPSETLLAGFDRLPPESQPLVFTLDDAEVPHGGHLQGVQMRFDARNDRHLAFLSHDSTTVGHLLVVEFPAELTQTGRVIHVHTFPSDGKSPPLRHAGGIQLAGDILAVGLEDNQQKTRSEVQFWDVSSPTAPVPLEHLTVRRTGAPEDKTAGAVGLVEREGDYLLAVGNWDSRAIDFYTSNGKRPADPACRFEFCLRWHVDEADRSAWQPDRDFAEYQAVNLVTDPNGEARLVAFASTPLGRDVVDVFAVDLAQPPATVLRKLARKTIKLQPGNHFRYAGGLWIQQDQTAILASPRNLARETRLSIAR